MQFAKGIALHGAIFIFINKNGVLRVGQPFFKFGVRLFSPANFENVGPRPGVNIVHLIEQLAYAFLVLGLGAADGHGRFLRSGLRMKDFKKRSKYKEGKTALAHCPPGHHAME